MMESRETAKMWQWSLDPQGPVLEPKLFPIYINELPQNVTCHASLYADNMLIYSKVNSRQEQLNFQT